MDRDEAKDVIQELGGKVTTAISKKTTYVVAGDQAGLSKMSKAEEFKIPILSEDGLLDLLRSKSGLNVTQQNGDAETAKIESKTPTKEKHNDKRNKSSAKNVKEEVVTKEKQNSNIKKEKESQIKMKKESILKSEIVQNVKIEQLATKIKEEKPTTSTSVNSQYKQNIQSVENKAWVDKYKPTTLKDIIGQQGAASNVVKYVFYFLQLHILLFHNLPF